MVHSSPSQPSLQLKKTKQKTIIRKRSVVQSARHGIAAAAAAAAEAARTSKIVGNALLVGIFFLCHRHFSIERDRIGFNSPEH